MPLVIDHIVPTSLGGSNDLTNLAAACYRCNEFKGAKTAGRDSVSEQEVSLFHPRTEHWNEHFIWIEAGLYIKGKTAIGRATVEALRLNNAYITESRKLWISEDWHPSH